jgi:C4-dicarboxylate-specific signal transduction histidine kinase
VGWVEHAWQRVLGEDGMFLGIRASNRDISDRKEKDLQNQHLREELAYVTRVTTAGQLSASLAHELRQPLTAIQCNVQAAERFLAAGPPDLAEVQEALRDIRSDSERAGGVIQRLRAMFHKTGLAHGALRLNDMLQETTDLLHSEFVLQETPVQLELAPGLPSVWGNRIELQQVVLNLIVNALEAMAVLPRASRGVQVRTCRENTDSVRVSIGDSGPGIPEAELSRLFEPFFTTKAAGMGMGLAICHGIIEAHGGRLWAVNNPEGGATFHLTLPTPPEGANA